MCEKTMHTHHFLDACPEKQTAKIAQWGSRKDNGQLEKIIEKQA
jgi:hypothetical protein